MFLILRFYYTRIFGALTGPKILAGTAPIKVGSARLVLVVLVACFEFLSGIVTHQRCAKTQGRFLKIQFGSPK